MWLYLVQIVIWTILFTWIYNNTNRSVFAAMIFHAMANLTVVSIFPVSQFGVVSLPIFFGLILVALVTLSIVVIWGPRTLAR